MEALERITKYETGYNCIDFECKSGSDRCAPDKGGSHGLHGMNIRFMLKGNAGAVQFLIYTGWIPGKSSYDAGDMMVADLGYHSKAPQYDGQDSMGPCEYLDGEPCYYDGSGLNAEFAYETLTNTGIEGMWRYLEEYYNCIFNDGPYPVAGEYSMSKRTTERS